MEGGKQEYKRGFWTVEEDRILMEYIRVHGKGRWNRVAKITGLKRCGKSCRLRWINYLSPSVKRGDFSEEEDDLIIRLHNLLGNRWSLIAGRVPGRTDNQVKNHWNTHLSKKLGIKKVKSKIGASSQTFSIQVGESLKSPSLCESNSRVPSNSIGGPVGQEGIKDLASLHEPTMSMEGNESSFWSSNDDFMNSSSVMEFMDEFSFDFGWHCL